MTIINRCSGCKIGTSYCVYTATEKIQDQYGRDITEVPVNNCNIGNSDEYAMFPDTEQVDIGTSGGSLLRRRECEYRDPWGLDIFNANLYLWESISTNITTGDTYELDVSPRGGMRRFDYDHPLYHIIDYNVPINKTGRVALTERCNVVGFNNMFLVSSAWEKDDGGEEAKKAIGIPLIRNCSSGLYGTIDKATGVIMHKSMKDMTSKIHTFKNFTNVKVNDFPVAPLNIFIDGFEKIDAFVKSVISDDIVRKRLYEAFKLIKCGKYINIYQLLVNNDVGNQDARKISNNVSTKDPKSVYQNSEGYRYNITKIKHLYFNIVEGKIDIPFGKNKILANIVNFILNDTVLLNHTIGQNKKHELYVEWYNKHASELEPDFADEIHPDRFRFNEYSSDNSLSAAITIVIDAIYNRNLLTAKDLPKDFKKMFKHHKEYMANFVEPRDPQEIGAAVLSVNEFLNVENDNEAYILFKRFLKHLDMVKPIEVREMWKIFEESFKTNNPSLFWDYIEDESTNMEEDEELGELTDRFSFQTLLDMWSGEDTLVIDNTERYDSCYIRIRQKRYYNKNNQDREHSKMLDEFEGCDMDNAGYENTDMFDLEVN